MFSMYSALCPQCGAAMYGASSGSLLLWALLTLDGAQR
jgi:hypothetical protein